MKLYRAVACASASIFIACAAPAFAKPIFLAPAEYDPKSLLPAPSADDSAATKSELSELERIQASRTPDDLARAKSDSETENATIFEVAIGSGFDLKALPATAKLLADVRNDEKEAATTAKNFFLRSRPWTVDANLQSCSKNDAAKSSYPSGHSTMGYAMGVILASLIPDKAEAILARAKDYAENRLVCGVHYRSDIAAGETLGTAVAVELMHNAQFKPEYDAAAQELKAAHLTK
jgi:acid phosphatase (class A)